jgi:DNA-binding SARP family transcriptional activator
MSSRDYGLRLFGGFALHQGPNTLDVPHSVQRLLGFVALNDSPLPRSYVADSLWPDTGEAQAHANLRTALWRLHSKRHPLLDVSSAELALNPVVRVDTRMVHDSVRKYRKSGILPPPESLVDIHGELMPGCWDSWIVFERERLRHEAIVLLEASANACLLHGNYHLATMLSLGAVECDSLRESTNLLNVRVRLAAGDLAGAIHYAQRYARALKEELDLPPPRDLVALLMPDFSLTSCELAHPGPAVR